MLLGGVAWLAPTGALLVAITLLTDVAAGHGVLRGDVLVGRWVQSAPVPFGDAIAAAGNALGSSAFGVPFGLAVSILLVVVRRRPDALLILGLTLARASNNLLKDMSDSPRPTDRFLQITERAPGLGFPSGHTMGTTLLVGGLAYIAYRLARSSWQRAGAVGAATGFALMTGFARVETGAHWPSDVLGGYLWGTLILLIAFALHRAHVAPRTEAA